MARAPSPAREARALPNPIAIEYTRQHGGPLYFLTAQDKNSLSDALNRDDCLTHSIKPQANSRAIWATVVLKMLNMNCGAMPMANMSSVTGTMIIFSL